MSSDSDDRRRIAVLAGHAGDAVTARSLLHDPVGRVRAAALGAVHRAAGLQTGDLEDALADTDTEVRCRALEVIAALTGGGVAATVPIVSLLHDPDAVVLEMAAWASGERLPAEPGAVAALADLATGADDALVREAAVAALGSLGDPLGLAAILAATSDKATVRRRAVLALAPFEGEAVDDALRRALDDRDWQVRQAAEDLGGAATDDAATDDDDDTGSNP